MQARTHFNFAWRRDRAYVEAAQWSKLNVFVSDAQVPLDNNATERGLRGPVIGRRNHFGSKSAKGTEVASVLCSLVESAKVAKV